MLREGAAKTERVGLSSDAERYMGLAGNTELHDLVASKILEWYAEATRVG
jgi:hypothetical protein